MNNPAPSAGRVRVAGLLLAAGSGRRFGSPKALADTGSGPWVLRALDSLAGLDPVVVVLGAAADQVAALLPPGVGTVRNQDHASGMGSSLRAGLGALAGRQFDAVLVTLVDLPDVDSAVVARLAELAAPSVLARAGYHGQPGHPVLIGREHVAGVAESAIGDRGARDYLATHRTLLVECGDLATGIDVDTRSQS